MQLYSKSILILFLICLVSFSVIADIELELQVSESTLYIGDEITLQLKVDGTQKNVKLKLPNVDGLMFRQLGRPSASSQTVIVNGKVSSFSGLVYTIGISATKKGNYRIPGLEIEANGQIFKSKPFDLRVKQSGGASNMKVTLEISNSRVYIDQPVILTLKWYLQDDIADYKFRLPILAERDSLKLGLVESSKNSEITELSVDGFKIPFSRSTESLSGEDYGVYTVKFEFFPASAGSLKIMPASVTAMIRSGTELKKDFFGRTVRAPKLKRIFAASEPRSLEVLDVPLDKRPDTYTGAVGKFDISVKADNTQVKVGDPIELTIRINGEGRFENIDQPLLSEQPSFKAGFVIVDGLQPGDIQGQSIEFKQIVRPKHDGVNEIPPIEFSYFNPTTGSFKTTTSQAVPIKVLSASRLKEEEIVSYKETVVPEVTSFTKSKSGISSNYVFEDALITAAKNEYWGVFLFLPPFTYLIILTFTSRRRRLNADQSLVRAKSAKSSSHKRLKNAAKKLEQEDDAFYLELSEALRGYIGDKLNLGAGQLTTVDIESLKQTQGLSAELSKEITDVLDEIDRFRFMNLEQHKEDKVRLLHTVSDVMKRLSKLL